MKSILNFAFSLLLSVLSMSVMAQSVTISVVIPPPYPIHVDDYLQYKTQSIITLTNVTDNTLQVKLLSSVSSVSNGVSAKVKESYLPTAPIQLGPRETKVLSGAQLQGINGNLTAADIESQGFDPQTIIRSGTLPEGAYQVCIRAHDYNSSAPLSSEMMGCAMLNLTWYDPPIIVQPVNESEVIATQPQFLNFVWTPAGLPSKTRYELRLVDMTAVGLFNPNDAFSGVVLPFFQKTNLLQSTYQYGVADLPLQNGHQYAVQVVAYDPTNSISFKNGGQSAVTTFVWKKLNVIQFPPDDLVIINPPNDENPPPPNDPLDLQNDPPPIIFNMLQCQEAVNIPNNVAINGAGIIGENDKLNLGGHELLLTEVNWNGKTLSGLGKITNSWFRIPILVEFNDLQVNADKVVLEGSAKARDDNNSPTEWINDLANIQFGEQEIQNAIDKIMGDPKRIVDWPNTKNIGVGMPVGIRRNLGGAEQVIAIVGMQFGVGGAGMNAVAQVNIPSSNQKLSFGVAGACFGPQGLTKEALLLLAEDYTVAPNKPVRMHLKKGDPNDPAVGTYVEMETSGFKKLQLDGSLRMDSQIAKPVDPQKTVVEAPFKIAIEDFHNFLLDDLTITPFELVKLTGFRFTVTQIAYDHSEVANPQGIVFPSENYNNEGSLWQGFYFKTLKVELPEKLNPDAEISATNMVVDKNGFSGTLSAPVVFGKEEGKMGERKWPFSMKNLYVRVVKNTLEEGRFDGQIRVPVTKNDFYFDYKTLLSYSGKLKYQFKLQPSDDVDFPAIIATGVIEKESHLVVEDQGNGFEPAAHFYGLLTLKTALGANLNGYDLSFKGIEIDDLMVDKSGVKLGPEGQVKYNSPQKGISGFDASIIGHSFSLNKIGFAVGIDFTKKENSVVGGTTAISILTDWEGNMLKFKKFQLDSISIKGDMSIVNVDGKVVFYHDDPTFGNGFKGEVTATVMLGQGGAGLGIDLELLIGKKKNEDLKYFYFDGSVELPSPVSIPLSASMRLFGFRGGVYHHMKRVSENHYVPDAQTVFGIKGGVAIGLDDRRAFHAKMTLEASFDKGGIAEAFFDGHAYVFTEYHTGFDKYPGSQPVYIGAHVNFNFKEKIFHLLAEASVLYPAANPVLSGNGDLVVHVDGGTKLWHVKMGTPENRITLNVLNLYSAGHYFMAGHGLGGLPELPPLVKDLCKVQGMESERNEGQLTGAVDPQSLGFALGSLYEGGTTGPLEWWIFYANLAYTAGFDVMLYKQQECPGIKDWYALGQMYAAFEGEVGLVFKFTKKSDPKRIPLLDAQFGAVAQAGLANPFWFMGTIHGEASFLGILEGDFHYEVHYGEKCMGKPDFKETGALDGLALIKDTNPKDGDKKVNVFARPEVALTFDPNKTYPLDEQDNEGNVTTRYFRFPMKAVYLRENKPGGQFLPGEFEPNPKGDIFTFSSEEALPGEEKIVFRIQVDVMEKINGQFVAINEEGETDETINFTTDSSPKRIDPANVLYCYPERKQRYYLQTDNGGRGFVQVKVNAYKELFDLTPGNQFEVPDKIKVRFIPVGNGPVVEGQYLGYDGERVNFSHPPLQNNRMYVAQFIKEISPSNWLANNQGGGNGGNNDLPLASSNDLIDQITAKQKVLGEMKLETREYEIFRYIFRTSAYNSIEAKLADFQSGTVDNAGGNAPMFARTVSVKGKEGFDVADQRFLTFDWSLGFGFGGSGSGGNGQGGVGVSNFKENYYWKDYLKPWIYRAHNEVLLPIAYPGAAEIQPVPYMYLSNPEPLLSNAEIEGAANQNINQQGLNFGANLPLKTMNFYLFGEMQGYQAYTNELLPKLFNMANPKVMACALNQPGCNPNLQQLMNQHLANPQFKKLTGGSYQTLVGYHPVYFSGMSGDSRQTMDWKKAFGIGN